MNRLISAGFSRLFNSFCFKVYMIFAVLYSALKLFSDYHDVQIIKLTVSDLSYSANTVAFECVLTMVFATAVLVGMFIGREYSDGTLRNKLTVGHSRGSLYLSNFIVCAAANVMGIFAALAIALGIGIPLIGTALTVSEILCFILTTLLASLAVTAVFTFFSMLISSKSVLTAFLILGSFIMLLVTIYINESLSAPEYYTDFVVSTTIDGETTVQEGEQIKNPFYLTGNKRKVYEFLDGFLPVSQLYLTANGVPRDLTKCAIYDIIILIAVTEAGVLLFCKKDIK